MTDADELFLCITNEGQLYERLSELARGTGEADRVALGFMVSRYAHSYNRQYPGRLVPSPTLTAATVDALQDYYRSE